MRWIKDRGLIEMYVYNQRGIDGSDRGVDETDRGRDGCGQVMVGGGCGNGWGGDVRWSSVYGGMSGETVGRWWHGGWWVEYCIVECWEDIIGIGKRGRIE